MATVPPDVNDRYPAGAMVTDVPVTMTTPHYRRTAVNHDFNGPG